MVRSRWAALSVLNLLLWLVVVAALFSVFLAGTSPWLRMAFVAAFIGLGFPLIVLAPLLRSFPELLLLLMILNSLLWGTFWDWVLRRFVDSPNDPDAE